MNSIVDFTTAAFSLVTSQITDLALKAQAATGDNMLFGIDMSIEGLRSQKYSQAIFVFLIISLIFFAFIIYLYVPKGKSRLKTGEKIMFGSIIAGIFIAVALGWLQLIDGYLL